MRRNGVLLLSALLVATHAWGAAPPARVQPPHLRFKGASRGQGWVSYVHLTFEVSNPNAAPLVLPAAVGINPSRGQMNLAPFYALELRRGGAWEASAVGLGGYCGPVGRPLLPANAKATLHVLVPEGGWDEARVGLDWKRRGVAGKAWSEPVPYKLVKGRK
jgi:hypothetical protein